MRSLVTALFLIVAAGEACAETPVQRGKYLVEVLGACGNCHTPKGPDGDRRDLHMAGGFAIEEAFGVAVSSVRPLPPALRP